MPSEAGGITLLSKGNRVLEPSLLVAGTNHFDVQELVVREPIHFGVRISFLLTLDTLFKVLIAFGKEIFVKRFV